MSESQNIIITGASKGIGFELTIHFLGLGHNVYAVSRSVDTLKELAVESANLSIIQLDITGDLSPLLVALEGVSVDHLINNAGYLVNKSISRLTDNDIRMQYEVNAIAPLRMVRELLPYFRQGASICNISSMGGVQGSAKFTGLSAYSSSKGAVTILTECLAEELNQYNIRCNGLALGAVQTEMLEQAFPEYKAPLSANEMASFIVDFVLHSSAFFNGKVLPVSESTP